MLVNLLVILAVSLWGLSFIATKIVLQYLSPSELITIRLLLGTPVIYLVARIRKIRFRFDSADRTLIVIASVILGAHFLIQTLGLTFTSATNTAWLIATIPAFVAVMSRIFLKERLNLRKIVGIALGSAGVVLLVSRGDFGRLDWLYSIGDWLVLATCLTWSTYTIITRNITRRYHPLALTTVILAIPAVSLTIVTSLTTPLSKFTSLPFNVVLLIIFLGVGCLGIAHWLWMEGLSRKGATEVGAFLYLEPIVTTAAAAPLLGEPLGIPLFIAAGMILAGVCLIEKEPSKSMNSKVMSND